MIFLWIINERMKDKGCKSHDGHLSCHHIIMSERDGWDRRCSQIKCQRLTHHGPCECQLFSLNSWINEYRTWLEFFKQSRSFASHFTAQVCATKCSLWLLEHRTDLFMYCMLFQTPPPARELLDAATWSEVEHGITPNWGPTQPPRFLEVSLTTLNVWWHEGDLQQHWPKL